MQVLRLGTRKKPRTVSRHPDIGEPNAVEPIPLFSPFPSVSRPPRSATSNICETVDLRLVVSRFAQRYHPAAEYSICSRCLVVLSRIVKSHFADGIIPRHYIHEYEV